MLHKLKSRGKVITGAGSAAVLALSIALVSCSGDKDAGKTDVTTRATESARRTATVALPAPPDTETVPVSIGKEEAVVQTPEPSKEVTYEEAETAYHERRYDEAVDLFIQYTKRKNKNPWGHYMLGLSSWKAGDHESAQEAFEQALELDPQHVKSWLNLSRVLLDIGRSEEALAKIEKALSLEPESNVVYRLRGRAYHQLGQTDKAVGAYRKAIQLNEEDAWAMNNMGLVFIEQGLFDKALPPLARAIELRSDMAVFLNNLGMALERTGHFRAAEEAYKSAITIDEAYEKASNNLARVEAVVEDPDLGPVDLKVIAQSFVDEIKSWGIALAGSPQPEVAGARTDSIVIDAANVGNAAASDVDSTKTNDSAKGTNSAENGQG